MNSVERLQIVAVPVLLLASQLSLAAPCNGRVNNVSLSADTIEVDKGHTVTYFVAHSIATSDNSINNTAGKCGGYFITTPDGKTRGVGVCARKSKGRQLERRVDNRTRGRQGCLENVWRHWSVRRKEVVRMVATCFRRREGIYGRLGWQLRLSTTVC